MFIHVRRQVPSCCCCRTYLRHQIRQYLQRHAEMPPKAVVLMALLVPDQDNSSADQESSSQTQSEEATSSRCKCCQTNKNTSACPVQVTRGIMYCTANYLWQCSDSDSQTEVSTSGQAEDQGILVGTVELSFATSTRARYLTLNAPAVR